MARALLVVVGVAIGVAAGVGLFELFDEEPASPVADGVPVDAAFPAVDHHEEAARELLAAWERWRTATFYARGTWERRLDGGGEPLQGAVLTVQDPPRRVVIRLGAVVEQIDGTTRACDTEIEGALAPPCVASEIALGYADRVAIELTTVERYILGDGRSFDVDRGEGAGCYRAENRAAIPAAPWGLWAEFCFDDGTGALVSARVRRASAVDIERMIEIRSEVTEEDFASR